METGIWQETRGFSYIFVSFFLPPPTLLLPQEVREHNCATALQAEGTDVLYQCYSSSIWVPYFVLHQAAVSTVCAMHSFLGIYLPGILHIFQKTSRRKRHSFSSIEMLSSTADGKFTLICSSRKGHKKICIPIWSTTRFHTVRCIWNGFKTTDYLTKTNSCFGFLGFDTHSRFIILQNEYKIGNNRK